MKRIIFLVAIMALPLTNFAQKKRIMLFDKYSQGTVKLFNMTRINAPLNYDASNKAMMYMDGENEMILMNKEQVDSILIGSHKFIYANGTYLECIALENGVVYIDWLLKDVNRGFKGVYGQVTQSKVESINTNYWQRGKYLNQSTEVYSRINENRYLFETKGKMVVCKSKKNLLNLFKEKKELINGYINKNNLDFTRVPDALNLIDYCLSLK
ncbi:hypothetical protein [Bacteroides sedimenti]|uniref:GLPGLI family protein n=1 Tax=Bacteroides sedimenti TaxID=2136147 RepID=A0ABN6Z7Q4_9BACE